MIAYARLCVCPAFYGWATAGRIIKRRQEGQPTPPAKWVLVGHSLGAMGAELVRASNRFLLYPLACHVAVDVVQHSCLRHEIDMRQS